MYREACRELRAPEDKIEEIIAMTEKTNQKIRRPLRTALICAAALAMMVVSVAAANPEGVQEFFYNIASIVQVDDYRQDLITVDGEKVTLYSCPEAGVEERDGRAILMIDGKEAADITDELKAEGRYTYESVSEGSRLVVTVEGWLDDWTAAVTIGDPNGSTYTFSSDSQGNGSASSPAYEVENFFVTGDGLEDVDGEITVGLYITDAEDPAQH
ncbi:hypothetical protein D1646_16420 [Pseudoflavonifractor sp. 60]|nr:hypothetical protein [Pseudoflavonifractor sp. 60]